MPLLCNFARMGAIVNPLNLSKPSFLLCELWSDYGRVTIYSCTGAHGYSRIGAIYIYRERKIIYWAMDLCARCGDGGQSMVNFFGIDSD